MVALWAWLRLPVGLFLLAAVLSIVYHIVPDTNRSFWSETPGALFAVIAWAITSPGFSFFLANFAGHGLTYGSLGTAVGLLVYLYLSASVVLLGLRSTRPFTAYAEDISLKTQEKCASVASNTLAGRSTVDQSAAQYRR